MHATTVHQTVRLKNKTNSEQSLWLEPLGDRIALQPNVLYELTAGDEFGKVEIDLVNEGFVIYGWVIRITSISETGDHRLEWEIPESAGSQSIGPELAGG